jgi:hypothetical protein
VDQTSCAPQGLVQVNPLEREDPTKSRELKNTGLVVTVPTYLLQQNSLSK